MLRLAYDKNPFSNSWRITATSEAFRLLLSRLSTKGPSGLTAELKKWKIPVQICEAKASTLQEKTKLVVELSSEDLIVLSRALNNLAEESATVETSLIELGVIHGDAWSLDLQLRKQDYDVEFSQDYSKAYIGFGTWEAVLFHEPASVEQFEAIPAALNKWASYPRFLEREATEQTLSPTLMREIYQELLANETFAELHFDHPLVVRYGSISTGGKLWLAVDETEVILPPATILSGNYEVDIRNFFLYLEIILELSSIVDAQSFLWGDTADARPASERRPIADLRLEDSLWDIFSDNFIELSDGAELPSTVREMFFRRLHSG